VIDTAIGGINPKKKTYLADIFATKLQYDINVQEYADAEQSAKRAINYGHSKAGRQRWTFILAQLQELLGKNADAIKNYIHVANSNASFEMAFNANLNRIRIEDMANGVKINRIDRLRALIRNENNKDFIDQTETAKMHEFWVFPDECTTVWMDKRTGIAYPSVCLIGINGVHYPLFPGNNRAPGFVYEALEDIRELQRRYKEKIAPPKTLRSVSLSDPRNTASRTRAHMMTNPQIFNDSMLGRPNYYDVSQDNQAANLIRQHRDKALNKK